jgi:hypothetical protein
MLELHIVYVHTSDVLYENVFGTEMHVSGVAVLVWLRLYLQGV